MFAGDCSLVPFASNWKAQLASENDTTDDRWAD
jgi:hypothetical protein